MTMATWPHTYEGTAKQRRKSKQWYAMKERRLRALGSAKRDETYHRVTVILERMRVGKWCPACVEELSATWHISAARVEQLAAEASRVNRRMQGERRR